MNNLFSSKKVKVTKPKEDTLGYACSTSCSWTCSLNCTGSCGGCGWTCSLTAKM